MERLAEDAVFLAFAVRETLAPERSGGEQGGSHAAKASENKGREHWRGKG
ncbi:MAG: hypothetical protein JRI33_01695 [Deltaproteobacteria bacterium]|nr:hypothetical protein [Deltaproteobacteria bacterium]